MKYYLLGSFLLFFAFTTKAQNVTQIPAGKYNAKIVSAQKAWDRGDIIIIDDGHYKLSSSADVGEYKLSVAAQRVFFVSGPLRSAFTQLKLQNNKPVIILPAEQNSGLGITTEVWASKE